MGGKILVTGSSGQIGSELTGALISRFGSSNVIATDIQSPGRNDCRTASLDVTDRDAVFSFIKTEKVSTVIHLAAILSARGEREPSLAFNVNVNGMRNILDASVSAGVGLLFFPSTIGVFGTDTPKENVPVETITRPSTMYGITKLLCEQLGEYYSAKYELDVRGMRLPGIVSYSAPPGGGTTDYSIEMLRAAAEGRGYSCFLKEDCRLPMMYMPDAIDSIMKMLEAPAGRLKHRTCFNVMAFSFSPSELEQEIRRLRPEFRVIYAPDERQLIADTWPRSLDTSAAAEEWGFAPSYTLTAMVEDMLKHLTPVSRRQ